MAKYRLEWINKGNEFDIPELTIGDVKRSQLSVLDVLREHKDLEGTRQLEKYLSQETGFALLKQILKRVDSSLTDTVIEDSLTFNDLNKLTNVIFEENREMLKQSGVDVKRPRKQPLGTSKTK